MTCHDANALLASLSLGEATAADRAALAEHAAACAACQKVYQNETAWLAVLGQRPLPAADADVLARARQRLHRALASEPARAAGRLRWWPRWGLGPLAAGWSAAGMAVMLVIGFGGGWWAHRALPGAGAGRRGAFASAAAPAATQVRVQAIEPEGAGRLRVVYETVSRQSLSGAANNPQLRHLLLLAAGQPANAGMQLESIAALRPAAGQDAVRQTLLAALAGDPNPGVRLEALNALRPLVAADPSVRAAMAQVVLRDPNPGLRMQAVAALAAAPRAEAHRWLRQLAVQSPDPYVRLNCVAAMRQLDIAPPPAALAPLGGDLPAGTAAPAPTQQ